MDVKISCGGRVKTLWLVKHSNQRNKAHSLLQVSNPVKKLKYTVDS
ncbi:hypothetical protein JZU46_00805 [bacterium]|nr:hypothetical protein [bacterium]